MQGMGLKKNNNSDNTNTGPIKNLHVDSAGQDQGHTNSDNSLDEQSPDKIKRRGISPNDHTKMIEVNKKTTATEWMIWGSKRPCKSNFGHQTVNSSNRAAIEPKVADLNTMVKL